MAKEYFDLKDIDRVADAVSKQISYQPRIGIILGSGLADLADSVIQPDVLMYRDLPGWPVPTVAGHQGRLLVGRLEDQSVLVMQGRGHYYEGYSMAEIGLPVRVMRWLGVEILMVTNAAGAVNPAYIPGDLMMIVDQINLIGMAGENPLRGPNLDEFGPRFPDMSQAFDRELLAAGRVVASETGIVLREGVYACLAGPSFETPADLRFLKAIGADAVGMSTVPEVIVARHSGMRVFGVSGISNKAMLDGSSVTTHEEVMEAGRVITPRLTRLIKGVLRKVKPPD